MLTRGRARFGAMLHLLKHAGQDAVVERSWSHQPAVPGGFGAAHATLRRPVVRRRRQGCRGAGYAYASCEMSMPATGWPARSYTSQVAPFGKLLAGCASLNAAGTPVPSAKSRLPEPNVTG